MVDVTLRYDGASAFRDALVHWLNPAAAPDPGESSAGAQVTLNFLLRRILMGEGPCALLCACAVAAECHRTVIAAAARDRFPELALEIVHLPDGLTGRG